MKHLNEDNLIQYAFDLLDAKQQADLSRHLTDCSDCRVKLAQIQQQFAVLDVLGEDAALPEELIDKTLAVRAERRKSPDAVADKAGRPSGDSRPRTFTRWVEWMAVAAAVVLICAVLLLNLPDTRVREAIQSGDDGPLIAKEDRTDRSEIGHSEAREETFAAAPKPRPVAGTRQPASLGTDRKTGSLTSYAADALTVDYDVRAVSADAIPDIAPFAPASAIELVVLPNPEKTQLTIYNSADLTLVRDTRRLTLKPGWNWLQFMWDGTLIDPTSLSLTPLAHADKVDIQQLVYPARLKDIGRWLIRSEVEGAVPFEITYFAAGLSWRAFYMGTLNADETKMNLKGYVNVANHSGQDFENAQTRLVVGETHLLEQIPDLARRQYPYGPDVLDEESSRYNWKNNDRKGVPILGRFFKNETAFGGVAGDSYFGVKAIEKEGLSEYFLYTIEGTENLPDSWGKRLPSFDVDDIPVKSLYKYDEDRYGSDTVRFVSFKNDNEHQLGTTPIPEGTMKIYRAVNAAQNLSYIGGADIKYIPVNEDVELNLGPARLVTIEPVLMDYKTDNYIADEHGDFYTGYLYENAQRVYNMIGCDEIETWQIKLTNARDIPVELEITRNFQTDYWDMNLNDIENVEYKKHDKNHARFTLTLPARTEQSFAYTVTKYLGQRSEAYIKQLQEQTK
jgi:hypothetical protein